MAAPAPVTRLMTLLMSEMAATQPSSNGVLMNVGLRIGIWHCCDELCQMDSELSRGGVASCRWASNGIMESMKALILAAAALAAVIGSSRAKMASHRTIRLANRA